MLFNYFLVQSSFIFFAKLTLFGEDNAFRQKNIPLFVEGSDFFYKFAA